MQTNAKRFAFAILAPLALGAYALMQSANAAQPLSAASLSYSSCSNCGNKICSVVAPRCTNNGGTYCDVTNVGGPVPFDTCTTETCSR